MNTKFHFACSYEPINGL